MISLGLLFYYKILFILSPFLIVPNPLSSHRKERCYIVVFFFSLGPPNPFDSLLLQLNQTKHVILLNVSSIRSRKK